MVLWTRKAENEYRRKYPHRENPRKAGTEVIWDGHRLTAGGSIFQAYKLRGWVRVVAGERITMADVNRHTGRFNGGLSTPEERAGRWKLMQECAQTSKSLPDLVNQLGLMNVDTIRGFCERHGEELAEKYGKLPCIPSCRGKKRWASIMEM